jgi:predicted AlkP superfamily phosphohydrolase/phosphomutase
LSLLLLLALAAFPADAYVGPGAGFGVVTSFLVVLNALGAAALSALAWPVLASLRLIRRIRIPLRPSARRVVVLGLDGFSPRLVRRFISEGELPAISALAASGSFSDLATTCPGISPVAWSSFQTGVNPGKHGIFDFLAPDRARYVPVLSSVRTERTSRGRATARLLRHSRPFWTDLGRYGLRSTVLRVPITYPPEPLDGFLLSGMCVPDLRGTQGSYTLFGSKSESRPGGMQVPLEADGQRSWTARIPGPAGVASPGCPRIGLRVGRRGWRLSIDGSSTRIAPGKITPWLRVGFRLAGEGRASGIARFRLDASGPVPVLYTTAIHPDPDRPPVPLSHPHLYSKYLAGLVGPYATLGLAEDTWALMDGVISGPEFLEMAWSVFRERRAMLLDALSRNRTGLVVCVFDTPDRIQHMFWREGTAGDSHVRDMYRRCDALVGEVAGRLRKGDLLLVISDHGFASFDTCVDLNRVLVDSGFMSLEDGVGTVPDAFEGVDWSGTKAYSLGLAGIFLNLEGREARGAVSPSDAGQVRSSIAEALLALRSPDGRPVVRTVYPAWKVYSGPYADAGPDLVVGMHEGFRASWNCATGGVGRSAVYPNDRHWSGDHCCDNVAVPGVLLSNRKLDSEGASIVDIAPTALVALGVSPPAHLDGRPLVAPGAPRR